jgi:hypothetical protein
MSTHTLDASGARPLTTTTNDPARTAATVQAKQGDDAVITFGGFSYVEIPIPTTAGACEVVVRRKTENRMVLDEHGDPVRDEDRNIVYEEVEVETRALRFTGYFYASGHTDKSDDQIPLTPHSTLRAVNFERDPNKPMWLTGETVSVEKIDLGYGVEVVA